MSRRAARTSVAVLAVAVAASSWAVAPPVPLEFHRVHVPADRLGEVPLGDARYVPMPLLDFEAALARARAAAGAAAAEPTAPADSARWRAALDESGSLVGTVSFVVGESMAGPGRVVPLGGLRVERGVVAGASPREATICGCGNGLAVAIPVPGTYDIDFTCPAATADAAVFGLPLVPALATTLELVLPANARPVLSGAAARHALVAPPAPGTLDPWRIGLGPAAEITIAIEPRDPPPPAVAVWADVALSTQRAELAAAVVPAGPWRTGRLVLEQDPALRVTRIGAAGDAQWLDHETAGDGRSITVVLPRWLEGRRTPLEVRGVAPASGAAWRLPLLRAAGSAWAGGGSVVRIDPAFAVRNLELDECRVVPPETVGSWPLPSAGATSDAAAARQAIYHVEQQGPAAALAITLGARTPSFDVARVTTVEITPNAVIGRAACDVRVTGGEAFEIVARVAPGWIIDAVDTIDRDEPVDDGGPRVGGPPAPALDWRVVPSPAGDALRIGLPPAEAERRGIGLRISGHRGRLAPGAGFTTGDIDMVRFEGEAADAAVIDLRTDADAFVEIDGRPAGWFDVGGRLAPLVEEGKARGRLRGGDRAGDVEARLVRRRPPLDVRVDVRLEPRDAVLVQTFVFDCRAEAGVESLVVDFAEPGGDGLMWRVESPAGIAVAARPLDPAEGGLASRSDAIAASWLVELSPAATGPVRIRAVRSVPFAATVPVPLAWIEGAVEPGGTVAIVAPSGGRPRVVNRGLRALPADAGSAATVEEFAFGPPQPRVAAEVTPVAAGADARAWAWRETVTCWCDESGATQAESRFDVENEGRSGIALALAPGRRLEQVLVGGTPVPDLEFGPVGGTWRIPLPSGERRLEVVVRTLAAGRSGRGAWRVDPAGCGLDVPVLDRRVLLRVPPELVLAAAESFGSGGPAWTVRLFGVGDDADDRDGVTTTRGYREVPVALARDRGAGVLVVSRRLLAGAATIAAATWGILAFLRGRRRPASACVLVVAAAVAALWLPAAFMPVARAAWWGGLAGLVWGRALAVRWPGWLRRAAWGAASVALHLALAASTSAADTRVFITPDRAGDGFTALVPEPLYRVLAAHAAGESAAIRVLGCRIAVASAAGGPQWRLSLDVDADAGGLLDLDAGAGGRWLAPPAATGVDVRVAGREARLTAVAAGRAVVELILVPAVERRGPVEIATARIPVAPRASLRITAGEPGGVVGDCEVSVAGGPFAPAPVEPAGTGAAAFDVSVADCVRLVRPLDPRDRLLAALRTAATVNALSWDAGGCRVEAVFDVDPEGDLLRSFIVRADPRLEGLAAEADAAAAPRLEPLGGGRVRVELPEAVRGGTRVRLTARVPLADPVGVFDATGLWLDGVATEKRTITLESTPEFDAVLDPPPAAGATAADLAGRSPARISVRRRRQQVRATQSLSVSFAPTGIGLVLESQIDATALALSRIPLDVPVGSEVDRVALLADDPAEVGGREPVDIEWTRTAADRVLVVVQRPRPGRFRLEVEARLARRPAPRGGLPLVRARLGAAVPLVVSWTAEPPLTVSVTPAPAGQNATIEVADGAAEPEYALNSVEPPVVEVPPPPRPTFEAGGMEVVEVRAAVDARGRMYGLARFDVVTPEPTVRLRLPPGMRLFDVLVEGHVVATEPRAADAWDVPLGSAPWPRTILVVFVGDTGTPPVDGRPCALVAPRLEGLSATEVLWSLRPPPGHAWKIAAPARPLDAAGLAEVRELADERIATACERAAAAVTEPERGRLVALAALRREGRGPEAEERWLRASGWDEDATAESIVARDELVVRAVPVTDPTTPTRAAATVLLVVVAGAAGIASARGRAARGGR